MEVRPLRYLRMTIVSLFTAAAITLPVAPHAAAANTTLEAESMVVSPASAGRVIADSSASGGYALELYQNSSASTNLSLPASISVVIRAKGQSCQGAPSMTVSIDGKAISKTTVTATSWTNYTTAATINAGTHTLSIAFTNAHRTSLCSRGLFLDTVTVVAVTAATSAIAQYSDLSLVFARNTYFNPAVALPPDFQTVSTSFGPGFQFVASDTTDVALWDSAMKAVLAKANPADVAMNTTQQWDFYVYLPSQEIVTSWNGGVLWEFHTPSTSSGHNIALDNTGRGPGGAPSFRFEYETVGGANYAYAFNWAALTFNAWHHFTIKVRWSLGSDGFYQAFLDGTGYQNFTGPTVYAADNGTPFLQFGFYADIGSKNGVASVGNNQVTIAGINYTTS
jgi:hypothetical protein